MTDPKQQDEEVDYESDDSNEDEENQTTFSAPEEEIKYWKERYQKKRTKYLELKKFYEEYTKSSEDIEKMFDTELKKAHADIQVLKNKLTELAQQKKIVDDENLKLKDKITFSEREIEILKKNDQVLMMQLKKLSDDRDNLEKALRNEVENLRKEKEDREKENLIRIQSQINNDKDEKLKSLEKELKTLAEAHETAKQEFETSKNENVSLKARIQTFQAMQKQQDDLLVQQQQQLQEQQSSVVADMIEKSKQQLEQLSQQPSSASESAGETFVFKFSNKLNEFKSKFRETILSMD